MYNWRLFYIPYRLRINLLWNVNTFANFLTSARLDRTDSDGKTAFSTDFFLLGGVMQLLSVQRAKVLMKISEGFM